MTTSRVRDISWRGERLLPPPLPDRPGDTALRSTTLNPAKVDAISVHHTTGAGLPAGSTIAQEITYLRRIDSQHRNQRGLHAIGYQLAAFASGRVYITAPLDRYGAAVALQNAHTISIALPGDFTKAPPAPTHLHAAAHAIAHVDAYLKRAVPVRGHRYWGGTACPGDSYRAWVPPLRLAAQRLHATSYTVVDGDTAYAIARTHNLTFPGLQRLNPSGPVSGNWALLHPGEKLRVS